MRNVEVITEEDPVGATPSLMYGVHCELTELNRMLTNRRGIQMKRGLNTMLPKEETGYERKNIYIHM